MLNPRVAFDDYLTDADDRFRRRLVESLAQDSECSASPCLALDIEFWATSWFRWYESQLRSPLITVAHQKGCSYREVLNDLARRTAILQLVPYYGNNGGSFPLNFINQFESSAKARAAAQQLGVSSRHLMDWVESKFIWGLRPELTEVFVGRESFEGLESSGEVVGSEKVDQVRFELVVGVVEVALHGSILDGSVHALDLPIGPGMVGLGKPVFVP